MISRHKLKSEFKVIGVFPIYDVYSSDQVFVSKLEILTSTADEADSSLLAHLADDDHAVEEVDVAVREPFPILNQNVQLSLCKENKAMFFSPIQSNLKIQNIKK